MLQKLPEFFTWDRIVKEAYQRPTDLRRVRRYLKEFDENQVNYPVVAVLEDGYFVANLDGAHTVDLLKLKTEDTGCLCRVVRGLDLSQRAALFLKLNGQRKAVNPEQRINAGTVAQDADDPAVMAALDASPYPEGYIRAFSRLKGLATATAYKAYGSQRVVLDTLRVLHAAYGTEGQGHFFDLYYPIANVLSRYRVRPLEFGRRLSMTHPHPYLFRVAVANRLSAYPTISGAARKEIITDLLAEAVGLMPQSDYGAAD